MNEETAACQQSGNFFSFPTWHKYLSHVDAGPDANTCQPHLTSIWDVWLIGAAVIEMLIRIAALLAIVYIVWGGVRYIQSRGDPNNTKSALNTIISAVGGLIIAVAATALISFVAGKIK
jgi:ABC-type Fe3+ transport system permease subunit